MAQVEDQLLSKIIRTGQLKEALDFGITVDDFLVGRNKSMLDRLIVANRVSFGSVIGPQLAAEMFPMFVLCDDESTSMDQLCRETRKIRMAHELKVAGERMVQLAPLDPPQAAAEMQAVIARHQVLGTSKNVHLSISRGMDLLLDRYTRAEAGLDTGLLSWPWPSLQEPTRGLQADDYVVYYGRPKCIPLDEPVLCADGTFQTIQKVKKVLAFTHSTQRLTPAKVVDHLDVVQKEVFELRTSSGYMARFGATHPILRPDLTYTETDKLHEGDWVGLVRALPEFPVAKDAITPRQAELLGLVLGDGNTTHTTPQYTTQDASIVRRLRSLTNDLGGHVSPHKHPLTFGLVGEGSGHKNPITTWLKSLGAWGKKSIDKTIPDIVYRSGREACLAVLGGLLATDGHVSKNAVMWNTSSYRMAQQIKHLLLRVGVVGSIGTVQTSASPAHAIRVHAQEQHEKLRALLPYVALPYKRNALRQLYNKSIKRKRHDDGVPWSQDLEDTINAARPKARNGSPGGAWPGLWNGFSVSKLFRRTGVISRQLLRTLAEKLKAPQLLRWANSDVRWERITSKRCCGVLPCADVTVQEHHNFVVGDFITHNSMKSFVLTYHIAHAYLQGKKVLVYTKEMTDENMLLRISAFMAEVPYSELRGGILSREHRDAYFSLKQFVNEQFLATNGANDLRILCGSSAPGGADTIQWFGSQIEEYKPDVAFIDGLYLMSDTSARKNAALHEKVLNISRAARALQLATKVPLIATMQANRKAAGHSNAEFDEIAYSDALGQDVTCAIRVINEKTGPTIALVLAGAREFKLHGIRIQGEPCLPFHEMHPLTEKDIDQAKNQDVTKDEPEKVAKKRTKVPPTDDIQAALNAALQGR